MSQASQEHGILTARTGSGTPLPNVPIGTRLRILPHHACATAAQHRDYRVIDSQATTDDPPNIQDTWPRVNGW